MKQLSDEKADYWFSQEVLDVGDDEMQAHYWGVHDALEDLGRKYVAAYGKTIGAQRIGILCAHGVYNAGTWYYLDGKRTHHVQSWIDKHDGQYALLALRVCNPRAETPQARKSLLLVPDSSFSEMSVGQGYSHFSLIHPTEGDLEYTIEYHLRELQK